MNSIKIDLDRLRESLPASSMVSIVKNDIDQAVIRIRLKEDIDLEMYNLCIQWNREIIGEDNIESTLYDKKVLDSDIYKSWDIFINRKDKVHFINVNENDLVSFFGKTSYQLDLLKNRNHE